MYSLQLRRKRHPRFQNIQASGEVLAIYCNDNRLLYFGRLLATYGGKRTLPVSILCTAMVVTSSPEEYDSVQKEAAFLTLVPAPCEAAIFGHRKPAPCWSAVSVRRVAHKTLWLSPAAVDEGSRVHDGNGKRIRREHALQPIIWAPSRKVSLSRGRQNKALGSSRVHDISRPSLHHILIK